MENQNNNIPNTPVTPAQRIIQSKSIGLCIFLSIITCGIYGWYWLYTLTEDVNAISGDVTATSGGMVILFSIITCNIYQWYWLYKQGERIDNIKASRGMPSSNSGILYIILAIFGLSIVSWAIMQSEINKLA